MIFDSQIVRVSPNQPVEWSSSERFMDDAAVLVDDKREPAQPALEVPMQNLLDALDHLSVW